MRRTDPIGGYNLVHVWGDSITVRERIIKTETRPAWGRAAFAPLAERTDTVYQRPDYSVNDAYPSVRVLWRLNDVTDVASQGSVDGSFYVYTNTAGVVRALDAADGRELWTFATGDKVFSTPFITSDKVIVSSCDGALYALSRKDGSLVWRQDTGYPIVACPLVADGHVYLGSSNGKFYSFNLEDGTPEWMCTGLQGYMESRPAVDAERVYTGTWGAKFYALDRKTGAKAWEFDTGKGRYFSPGACWPVVLPYEKDGRRGEQVIVLSSDYFVRAFNPADGKILWASDEAKGRESLGFSPDGKTMYVKGIGNNLTAVDVSRGVYSPLWTVEMPYKGNFIPTRMPATGKLVFVPTEFGVVHAVALSDGRFFDLDTDRLKEIENRISVLKRKLSLNVSARKKLAEKGLAEPFDKTKPGRKRRRLKERIQRLYRRMRCIRLDFYRKTAHALAQEYGCVYAEDLKTKNMTKSAKGTVENPGKKVKQKSGLNRAILRTGFYGLTQAIAWQLEKTGGILEKVNPAYTSSLCPVPTFGKNHTFAA